MSSNVKKQGRKNLDMEDKISMRDEEEKRGKVFYSEHFCTKAVVNGENVFRQENPIKITRTKIYVKIRRTKKIVIASTRDQVIKKFSRYSSPLPSFHLPLSVKNFSATLELIISSTYYSSMIVFFPADTQAKPKPLAYIIPFLLKQST